jgi:hypothetical protein
MKIDVIAVRVCNVQPRVARIDTLVTYRNDTLGKVPSQVLTPPYLRFIGHLSRCCDAPVETDYNGHVIARIPAWPRAVYSSMKQFEL